MYIGSCLGSFFSGCPTSNTVETYSLPATPRACLHVSCLPAPIDNLQTQRYVGEVALRSSPAANHKNNRVRGPKTGYRRRPGSIFTSIFPVCSMFPDTGQGDKLEMAWTGHSAIAVEIYPGWYHPAIITTTAIDNHHFQIHPQAVGTPVPGGAVRGCL